VEFSNLIMDVSVFLKIIMQTIISKTSLKSSPVSPKTLVSGGTPVIK